MLLPQSNQNEEHPRPTDWTHEGIFDQLDGYTASGWAWNPARPTEALTVVFTINGEPIHTVKSDKFRKDLQDAGKGTGYFSFNTQLPLQDIPAGKIIVEARILETDRPLQGSPKILDFLQFGKCLRRSKRHTRQSIERMKRRLNRNLDGNTITVIMPVYNTRIDWLTEAIESVRNQWCDAWQLICIDDGSTDPLIQPLLYNYSIIDKRIKIISNEKNLGIAASINRGIENADGDLISFLDHDDKLEPDAAYHCLRAFALGADLIYSDELITGRDLNDILALAARPAFSHDYYLSHPYFVHMVCVRKLIALHLCGWDETLPISADVDFILRAIEVSRLVAHIPKALYRWRTHSKSAGHERTALVMETTRRSIQNHLNRISPGAAVTDGFCFNNFRILYPDNDGRVLIVIPTKNKVEYLRRCIESIERTTLPTAIRICVIDHDSDETATKMYLQSIRHRHIVLPYKGEFNYSKMNNIAVRECAKDCRFVLFLNNDVEAYSANWLSIMRRVANRDNVGVVGATLLYGDGKIQHAGVIVGINGYADHAHRGLPYIVNGKVTGSYMLSTNCLRDYSAVTAACMMMRVDVFNGEGGFDETLKVGFNDTDLCLRVGARGYCVLNAPDVVMFHYESQTRRLDGHLQHINDDVIFSSRWSQFIQTGDPFYNPILSLAGKDHQVVPYPRNRYFAADVRMVDLHYKPTPGLTRTSHGVGDASG